MKPREYCSGTLTNLERNLTRLGIEPHDPANPDSAWNDIRLNVDSLGSDYHAAVTLENTIDEALRQEVALLMQRSIDEMPGDVDVRIIVRMREQREEVLALEAIPLDAGGW